MQKQIHAAQPQNSGEGNNEKGGELSLVPPPDRR